MSELKRIFYCNYKDCERSYTTAGNLKSHTKTHDIQLQFKCTKDSCSKLFHTTNALRLHQHNNHTKENSYICQYQMCDKRYSTLYRLKSHLRVHNGLMFVCSQCNKQFTSNSDLKKHLRIHSGDKPFKCEYQGCSAKFLASHHLKNHLTTHQNKPFMCRQDLCKKKFKSYLELENHFKNKHCPKTRHNKNIDIHDCPVDQVNDLETTEHEKEIELDIFELEEYQNNGADLKGSDFEIKSFNELRIKFYQASQTKISQSDALLVEFLINSKEIDTLLQSNEISGSGEIEMFKSESCLLDHKEGKPGGECQELCCLLNYNSLEEIKI